MSIARSSGDQALEIYVYDKDGVQMGRLNHLWTLMATQRWRNVQQLQLIYVAVYGIDQQKATCVYRGTDCCSKGRVQKCANRRDGDDGDTFEITRRAPTLSLWQCL